MSSKRLNDTSAWLMAESIQAVLDEKLVARLQMSPVISVVVDNSDLVDNNEYMAVSVIILEQGRACVEFLNLKKVVDATASGLFSALCSVIGTYGVPLSKVYGFGSDDAAVMLGSRSGLAAHLKGQNPFMLPWHCMVHQVCFWFVLWMVCSYSGQQRCLYCL